MALMTSTAPDRRHPGRPAAGAAPLRRVGALLGVSGEQVRERLARMLETGLIRRIGAVPNHYRLGFTANGMSVWDVDDARSMPGRAHRQLPA
jgi:DNA-binding Lrp family transcriptional regulator